MKTMKVFTIFAICIIGSLIITNISFGQSTKAIPQERPVYEDSIINFLPIDLTNIPYNKYDSDGEKEGIWVKSSHDFLYFNSYKNSIREGVTFILERAMGNKNIYNLITIENYHNDTLSGSCIYTRPWNCGDFEYIIVDSISTVQQRFSHIIDMFNAIGYVDVYLQGYIREFSDEGFLKREGWALFEHYEMETYKVGIWNEYYTH